MHVECFKAFLHRCHFAHRFTAQSETGRLRFCQKPTIEPSDSRSTGDQKSLFSGRNPLLLSCADTTCTTALCAAYSR